MSNRIIDERVVKMEFDNGKFEQNAQASLKTIEKLQAALKFENADKGFSTIEKSANQINLGRLENNIQAIANRFSTMGIIGDQVLRNITNSVTAAVHKISGLLAAPINQMITGGKARAMNIANAQFSLKGQGIDWKKESEEFIVSLEHMTAEEQDALEKSGKFVDSLYKDIDYAVSGTAYGLDSAAKAAAQLSASGVQIGDDMRIALRGISGVAAMTNTSYDDIARIFMHIAGKNKVQLEELNMISERGLGVSAKLAEAIGVSEAEISDMVSKGKIDFATFAKAMDDAFGEHAKDANNTFTGALSNMKAALSRIGADVAGPVYDAMIKPLNDIRSVIDNIRVALQPLFKDVEVVVQELSKSFSQLLKFTGLVTPKKLGIDQMPNIVKTIKNLEDAFINLVYAIARIVKPIRVAFFEVFQPTGNIFVKISQAIKDFTSKLIINGKTQATIYKLMKAVFTVLKTGFKILGSVAEIILKIADALSPLLDFLLELITVVVEAIGVFVDWVAQSDLLDIAIQTLSMAIPYLIQFITQLISGVILLAASIVGAIASFIEWISQFELLNKAIKFFGEVLNFLIDVGQKIGDTFKSFFDMLFGNSDKTQDVTEQTEEMSGVLGDRLAPALDDASEKAEKTQTVFEKVAKFIGLCIETVDKAIKKFYAGSRPLAAGWKDFIGGINIDKIFDAIEDLLTYLSKFDFSFEGIGKAITDGYNKFLEYMGVQNGRLDWDRIMKIGKLAMMFKIISDLLGVAKKTSTVATQFSKEFNKLAEALQDYLAAEAFSKRVAGFKKICEGIILIAAALFIVGAIREDRLIPAVIALGILIFVGAALMEAIKYLDKRILPATDGGVGTIEKIIGNLKKIASALAMSFTITGIGASILMISIAMWVLAGAFISWNQILSDPKIDTSKTLELFVDIYLAVLAMMALAGVISKIAPATGWTLLGVAAAIIGIVIAIYAMLGAILLFDKIPWDHYKESFESVTRSIGSLIAAALVIGFTLSASVAGVGVVLLGLAAGILAIAYACTIFDKLPWYSVVGSLFAIGAFLIELVIAMQFLLSASAPLSGMKFMQMVGIGFTIMSLAYAVGECANVVKKLSELDPVSAFTSFLEVVIMMATIGWALSSIGKASPKAAPVLAMAILMGAISMSLAIIATYDWEDIIKSIVMLGSALGACALVLKYANVDNHSYMRIFAMAAVIVSVGISLSLLAKLPITDMLKAGVGLAATIAVISYILSKISVAQGRPRTISAFALAIVAIAGSIWLIARLPAKQILAASVSLSIAIGALAGSLIALSKFGQNNIGIGDNKKVLITMIGLIAAVGGVIFLLARFTDTEKALASAFAVTMLMAAVTTLYYVIASIKVTSSSFNKSKEKMFIAIGAILAWCAIIVGVLSFVPADESIFTKIEAIIALLIAFGVLYAVVANMKVKPAAFNQSKIGMFVYIGVLIAVMAVIVGLISQFANPDRLIEKVLAITILVGTFIGLYAAIALIPTGDPQKIEGAIGILITAGVIIALLSILMYDLSKIKPEEVERAREAAILLAQLCVGFIIFVVALGALSAIASVLEGVITAGLEPLAILAAIVAALVIAFVQLAFWLGVFEDALNKNFGFSIEETLERGISIIETISNGLGRIIGAFVGGIAGAFWESSSEGFAAYCNTIQDILTMLKPVINMIATYGTEKTNNISTIVGAINTLFSAFSTLQFNDIDAEGTKTKTQAMVDALDIIVDDLNSHTYDATKATTAVEVAKSIGELYKSFVAIQGYEIDAESLGTTFKDLAKALVDYDEALSGHTFNVDSINSAKTAAEALSEMVGVIDSYVELEQKLYGFSDIPTMGANLVEFGECLVEFNDVVSDVEWNSEAMTSAMETMTKLVEMNNSLNPLYDGFKKYSDMEDFGKKLLYFAYYFSAAIAQLNETEFDTDKIDQAIGVAERLNTLAGKLGEDKGIFGYIFGDRDGLDEFGKDIASLGEYLATFNTSIADLDLGNMDAVLASIDNFLDEFVKISESSYDNEIVRNMIGRLPDLGRNIKDYGESVAELDTAAISKSATAAKQVVELFNQIGQGTYTTDAITSFTTGLETLGTTSFEKFITAFNSAEVPGKIKNAIDTMFSYLHTMDNSQNLDKMYKIGQNYIIKFVDGMKNQESLDKIAAGMTTVISEIEKAFQNKSEDGAEDNILSKMGSDMLRTIAEGFADQTARDNLRDNLKLAISWACVQAMLLIEDAVKAMGAVIDQLIAKGILEPANIQTIASAIQSAIETAVSGVSVNVSVPVTATASGVLGVQAEGVKEGAATYCSVVKTSTAQVTTSQNQAVDTISKNDAKASAKARKEYSKQRHEERQKIREEAKKTEETFSLQSAIAAYKAGDTSAFNAEIEKGKNQVVSGIGKASDDGITAITAGAAKFIDAEEVSSDDILGAYKKQYEELTGLVNEEQEKANEQAEDAMQQQKENMEKIMGTGAGGVGKGGGGGAGGSGSGYVASYSEFWQNLYLVNHQGMNAFEQQFETFEAWQENTLKKTQEIIDNYKNAVVDAKKKAAEGLFSEVAEPKEDVTKEKLKQNLQDQVNQIKEFNNIILQLRTRLMGTNLFDAITEMGVDSIDELRALNSMTNEELSEYASLYDQKYVASFQTIQQKAQSELQNLYGGMAVNIDQFAATFDGSLNSVEGYFAAQAEAIKAASAPVGQYFMQGVAEGFNNDEAKEAIRAATEQAMVGEADSAVSTSLDTIDAHSPAQDERVQNIGSYFTQGIAQGMTNEEALQSLMDAAELVMAKILEAFALADENQEGGSAAMLIGEQFTTALTNALTDFDLQKIEFFNRGVEMMTQFVEGFKSQQSIAQANINIVLTTMANNIKGIVNTTKFKTAGTELFQSMMKGFLAGWTGAGENGNDGEKSYGKTVIEKVMKGIIDLLKKYKGGATDSRRGKKGDTFFKVGQEFINGLIKGLENKEGELYAAVKRIVEEAIATAKAAAAVASPSKKTTEIGEYMGMGLVNGLNSMSGAVSLAAESITEEALNGFRDISAVLGGLEDFDASPVIAPVMDLTGVQNGVSEMGNLLSRNSAFDVAASVNSNLETQRTARLNEMTDLRRAMDSIYNSNSVRSAEMAQLQAAVATLNTSINSQTVPDYAPLQGAINSLNSSLANQSTGETLNLNNTFNIQSNDPEAVAEEVNNALQQMIDRRTAVWA